MRVVGRLTPRNSKHAIAPAFSSWFVFALMSAWQAAGRKLRGSEKRNQERAVLAREIRGILCEYDDTASSAREQRQPGESGAHQLPYSSAKPGDGVIGTQRWRRSKWLCSSCNTRNMFVKVSCRRCQQNLSQEQTSDSRRGPDQVGDREARSSTGAAKRRATFGSTCHLRTSSLGEGQAEQNQRRGCRGDGQDEGIRPHAET